MDNFEIDELALAAVRGDDIAMAKLIEVISPVARAKAVRLTNANFRVDIDDLTQEGMLGFLDAVKHFDITKGYHFKAYANKCIENRIISAIRENSNSRNIALSSAVSIQEDDVHMSGDPAEVVIGSEAENTIRDIVENRFSEFEKSVYELKMSGESYKNIATVLSCTEKAVDNAMQRIRTKIKVHL